MGKKEMRIGDRGLGRLLRKDVSRIGDNRIEYVHCMKHYCEGADGLGGCNDLTEGYR